MVDVVRQLEAEQRLFGYTYHPDAAINAEFTRELARVIGQMGFGDIREIGWHVGTEDRGAWEEFNCYELESGQRCESRYVTRSYPVAYYFNTRTGARLGEGVTAWYARTCASSGGEGEQTCFDTPIPDKRGPVPFYTVRGPDRWVCVFSVGYTDGGIPFFIPQPYRETSSWQDFRGALTFFFAVASFAIPGLGAAIGQYVFGAQLAASYPALVGIATNTALNAVLGGADIDDAVRRAVANYAGAGFGDIVGAQIDSALIGKLTGAATVAQLNGADVQQAVSMALLQAGASGAISLSTAPATVAPVTTGENMGEDFGDFGSVELFPDNVYTFSGGESMFPNAGDYGVALDDGVYAFAGSGDDAYGVSLGSDLTDFGAYNEGGAPVFGGGDFGTFDPSGGDYGVTPTGGSSTPPIVQSGTDWDAVLSTITKAALTAIQINKVYQASGSPPVKVAQPSQTVNRNGTITTRTPTGTVATSKLPVGAPYALPDGSLIINNGDGTYSITSPSGAVTKGSYTATAGLSMTGGSNVALLAAVGVGALLLLRKGK